MARPFPDTQSPVNGDSLAVIEANNSILPSFVSQEVFATTYGTLASAGESFFTSLLSGRHKNTTDDSGALFIDSESVPLKLILHQLLCSSKL